MKIRKISAIICVLLLLAVCGCSKDQETNVKPQDKVYRNVKVVELNGNATLTRAEKQQTVYKQMVINGGDKLLTEKESTVDLLLDSDKYARIYENSEVSFELKGSASKGVIRIYLNKGGINTKIESKLSADDCYEVHTPDAVMAVRGTEFEVIVNLNGDVRTTTVTTTSGSVEITLSNKDSEQRLNAAGEVTVIESKADGSGNMGEPKFKEACVKCIKLLDIGTTHLLNCGDEHYSCDGNDHSVCSYCKKLMCDTNAHKAFECELHYPCGPDIYDGHNPLACGHYICTTINDNETIVHELCVNCKLYGCKTDKSHFWAECGCVYCDTLGSEHIMCEFCYSCKSDGKTHAEGVCNN